MKTWLIIVSVVVVLLAASAGVGFWMLTDAKADLASTQDKLADIEAELAEIQEKLEENSGYWWEGNTGPEFSWGEGTGETISDLELRVDDLEWTVQDLRWAVRDLEDAVQDLEWQLMWQS